MDDPAVSPHYLRSQCRSPMPFDLKVDVFADRVWGWQLDIADRIQINELHGGFAVLSIVASYFEMIAKYEEGFEGTGESKNHFAKGVRSVLQPALTDPGNQIPDDMIDVLWEDVRCGMYHDGITGQRITVSGAPGIPVIQWDGHAVTLDPHQLVLALRHHFAGYVARLRDEAQTNLRANFVKRFG